MVRIPHPENRPGDSNDSLVRMDCELDAIPEKRHWPALELRTRHWRFLPSSARANMPSSSDQNAAENLLRRSSACALRLFARSAWPRSSATAAIPFLAA